MTPLSMRYAIGFAALALAACASKRVETTQNMPPVVLHWSGTTKHVVVMPPEFDLYELTATTGVDFTKPRSDWSATAAMAAPQHIADALALKGVVADIQQKTDSSAPEDLRQLYSADYGVVLRARGNYRDKGSKAANAGLLLGLAAVSVALPGLGFLFGLSYLALEGGVCDSACQYAQKAALDRGEEVRKPDFARLALIDLRIGETVWIGETDGTEWTDELSAKRGITDLLKTAPL